MWSIDSYKSRPNAQAVAYDDPAALARASERLREMPPLVTSWEVERLREQIADAQLGKRFLLQGGDCAETLADCTRQVITAKLKILLQMSLVLVHASQGPVIRVGRIAGQYAKPRTEKTEKRDGVELPSFFGDSVNAAEFTPEARRPDPARMISAYQHAGLTINFIRSLVAAGFADVTHPEYWDLGFKESVPKEVRAEYEEKARSLAEALRFMAALGERTFAELARVEFFTSHEALHLDYEAAQTTTVPRRAGHYLLSTHFPWIGERTRDPNGAHVEFLRGVRNPIGVKLGPSVRESDLLPLLDALDPKNEPGRITLITRMGAQNVGSGLLPIIESIARAGRRVLWIVDPMHGNTMKTASGRKTRRFDDILLEIERTFDVHAAAGTRLGGVHFELTGEDVTECIGGAVANVTESDLDDNYATACDPRLNYRQALEMSFFIARRLKTLATAGKP
ncbi:MAG TPA: 3-deoxy-7-phosphoheptulonate synthase class II [Polyangiaceae bacterium]|jgi:3-deoxy-7-phosphoheptulonate synthase|nr:3-deoxy-7-phosphoheptulonate synthase class II [Polyangiaceae bacterium]